MQLSIHHWLFSPFSQQWFSPRVDRVIPFGFEPVFHKENVTDIAVLLWDSCQLAASIIRTDSLEDILLKLRKHFWGEKVLTRHFENSPVAFLTKNLSWLAHWKLSHPQSSRLLDKTPLLVTLSPNLNWPLPCPEVFGLAVVSGGRSLPGIAGQCEWPRRFASSPS